MNDTVKWILMATISMVAIFFGITALGFDWYYLHSMILSVFETIGLLLILFTGSAAAIEVARYYRARNQSLKAKEPAQSQYLDEDKVRALVQQTIEETMLQFENPSPRQVGTAQKRRAFVHPEEASRERVEKS